MDWCCIEALKCVEQELGFDLGSLDLEAITRIMLRWVLRLAYHLWVCVFLVIKYEIMLRLEWYDLRTQMPILVMFMLKVPCKMISNVYTSCWMYMMHYRIELDEFGVKNAKFALQTRGNSLLAKYFANSEIFPDETRHWRIGSDFPIFQLAYGLVWGPVVSSDTFLAMFFNVKTPKHHRINAHYIERFLNQKLWTILTYTSRMAQESLSMFIQVAIN